jgi:hypothetical protein
VTGRAVLRAQRLLTIGIAYDRVGIATRMCDFKFPPLRASPSRMIEAAGAAPAAGGRAPPRGGHWQARLRRLSGKLVRAAGRAPNLAWQLRKASQPVPLSHSVTESYP